MKTEEFLDALDALVAEKHLLKHPFYTLWSEGKLTRDHIREYAVSYYPHVAAFPTYVSGVHSGCDDPTLRAELLENLVEEEGGPVNHPALWRQFAAALGAVDSDLSVSPRTAEHHVAAVLTKLGVSTRRDAARRASELGLRATT